MLNAIIDSKAYDKGTMLICLDMFLAAGKLDAVQYGRLKQSVIDNWRIYDCEESFARDIAVNENKTIICMLNAVIDASEYCEVSLPLALDMFLVSDSISLDQWNELNEKIIGRKAGD